MSDGSGYAKPLPTVTHEDREFWAAAREHRFVLPRCRACGHVWFPPYASCPSCLSFDRGWTEASGRGTVWGFTLMRQPYIPSFEPELPYNVVLVELEEGPMVYSNLVGIDNDDISCGLAVEAVFEDATDEITLIKFRPVLAARAKRLDAGQAVGVAGGVATVNGEGDAGDE